MRISCRERRGYGAEREVKGEGEMSDTERKLVIREVIGDLNELRQELYGLELIRVNELSENIGELADKVSELCRKLEE